MGFLSWVGDLCCGMLDSVRSLDLLGGAISFGGGEVSDSTSDFAAVDFCWCESDFMDLDDSRIEALLGALDDSTVV